MRADAQRRSICVFLFVASVIGLALSLLSSEEGDVRYYHTFTEQMRAGVMPYANARFEYPPYFFLLTWLPSMLPGWPGFLTLFVLEMLALDVCMRGALLVHGSALGRRSYAPFLLATLMALCGQYYYLKRFDLLPAACVLFALLAFSRGRVWVAGALIGIGIGAKAYPVLLLPAMLLVASRQRTAIRLMLGLALSLLPLAVLAFFLPWWRFARFHSGRGLQAESLYASLIWLAHHLQGLPAQWKNMIGWREVGGVLARASVPYARVVFALIMLVSLLVSLRYVSRTRAAGVEEVTAAVFAPLLGFVTFNLVLSPQYLIWLAGPAALLINGCMWRVSVAVMAAAALTPTFFPNPLYFTSQGLALPATIGLVLRNCVLIYGWCALISQLWRLGAEARSDAAAHAEGLITPGLSAGEDSAHAG